MLFAFDSFANSYTLQLDQSYLKLKASYFYMFTINAYFKSFEGEIVWNENRLDQSYFEGNARVRQLTTGNSLIDKRLYSKMLFNADEFPNIFIKSKKITKLNETQYLVEADLIIKNISRSIKETLIVTKDIYNVNKLYFDAEFYVSRADFGLGKNLSGLVVKDLVLVSFRFTAIK